MRRLTAVMAVIALGGATSVLAGSDVVAQQQAGATRTLTVTKVVDGTASSGFVVQVACEVTFSGPGGPTGPIGEWELAFLADGSADPANPPEVPPFADYDWTIVNGSWQFSTENLAATLCEAVETEDAGADVVTYECRYEEAPVAAGTFPEEFDACEQTEPTQRAVVTLPLGPFGEFDPEPECDMPWPEECVDHALFTITNRFLPDVPDAVVQPPVVVTPRLTG